MRSFLVVLKHAHASNVFDVCIYISASAPKVNWSA
jgi:hypothetical protein